MDHFADSGLDRRLQMLEAPLATREQLLRVHDADFVDEVFAREPEEGVSVLDSDTVMGPGTLEAARRAAGAVVAAVDRLLRDEVSSAFCCVRPPGHHAERRRAMGFCFFNSVAVGAAHALDAHGLSRVAILDFDVHHGNGTEDIFRHDERVLFGSTFQHPLYPGTGADSGTERILNVPLPAGTDGAAFRSAVERHWIPVVDRFRPELILVSAGFDAHAADPLGGLRLREDDYRWVTEWICAGAGRHCDGRVVSALEGGYDLDALAHSAAVHVEVLLEHARSSTAATRTDPGQSASKST